MITDKQRLDFLEEYQRYDTPQIYQVPKCKYGRWTLERRIMIPTKDNTFKTLREAIDTAMRRKAEGMEVKR